MVGFHVDGWDYLTFAAMFIIVAAGLTLAVLIMGLPGRIAIARKHPEADAVKTTGRGNGWTQSRVCSLRSHNAIATYREGERRERGEVTLDEAAAAQRALVGVGRKGHGPSILRQTRAPVASSGISAGSNASALPPGSVYAMPRPPGGPVSLPITRDEQRVEVQMEVGCRNPTRPTPQVPGRTCA